MNKYNIFEANQIRLRIIYLKGRILGMHAVVIIFNLTILKIILILFQLLLLFIQGLCHLFATITKTSQIHIYI